MEYHLVMMVHRRDGLSLTGAADGVLFDLDGSVREPSELASVNDSFSAIGLGWFYVSRADQNGNKFGRAPVGTREDGAWTKRGD